jgi:hypothetical protein
VEQPCYKCGASVEEGIAFCPQCNAPQIRVVAPEPAEYPTDLRPSAPYIASAPRARELRFPDAWWAAGLGIMAGAIPVVVLFGLPPGLGMMVAGFLAVLFYRRRLTPRGITVGLGARLGALCGLLASGALAVGIAIAATIFHQGERMHKGVLDLMQQSMARMSTQPPPEVVEMFKTPAGIVLLAFVFLFATLLFATVGGMLGAALLGRKDKA